MADPRAVGETFGQALWTLSADLLAVGDADGFLRDVSPGWQAALGYSVQELTARPWTDFVHPDDAEATAAAAARLFDPERPMIPFENRYLAKDGRYHWLAWRAQASEDGTEVSCIARDITELKEAAEALADSERRFRAMFEHHDAVMLLIDPTTWEIVDANPSAARFYGYRVDELAGMPITQISILPADELARRSREAMSGEVTRFLVPHRLASGEIRTVDVHSSPIEDRGRTLLFSIIHDETDRLRAERERAEAERRYQLVAENTDEAVLLASPDGQVTWASPSFERLLGYTADEATALSRTTLLHPDDLAAVEHTLAQGRAREGGSEGELRVRRKDGQYRWMAASGRVLTDPEGSFVGRLDTLRDIHEQVLARQALADSEERLHLVLGSSRLGLWDWNMQGDRVVANERWAEILGYRLSDLEPVSSATWGRLIHPDDLAAEEAMTDSHAQGLIDFFDIEIRMRHRDGRWIWVRDRGRIVERTPDGRPLRMTGTLEDITERVLTRMALTEERERLELVLDASRLGLWDWDLQTDELMLDERWAEIAGYRLEELEPVTIDTWRRLSHPDDVVLSDAAIDAHRRGETAFYDYEGRLRHHDGHWAWVRDRGRIVERSADGCPLRMAGTLEDVTLAHEAAKRLATAEEQFRLAMDNSAIGMCLVSREGRFLRVNPALCQIMGRDADDLQATTWQVLTHPDDLDVDLALVQQVLDGTRSSYRLLKRFVAAAGHLIWGDLSVAAVRNDDGTVRYFVSQIVDVTERVTAQEALSASEGLLRAVLDNSRDITLQLDPHMRIEYANRTLVAVSGVPAEQWIGKRLAEVAYTKLFTSEWEVQCRQVFATGEPVVYQYDIQRASDHRWYEAILAPEFARDGSVAHVVATSRDVTLRRHAEQALRELATHDPLTGLANRTALLEEIVRALNAGRRSGRSTAVLMIDLDHFKNANDTLGHAAGDEILQSAAARIEAAVRGGDLVARPGGDEFVVVMRDLAEPGEALNAAERLVAEFRRPFTAHGGELYATASIGVAIATATSQADQLVLEADTAMYAAKADGRDRVMVFNEDLRTAVTSRLAIEADLRHALDRGELAVWYQPEIDLATGTVIAVEALLRWHHPDGDIYTADRFIEIAEETGLILDIGDWVLREACAQAATWATARPDRRLKLRVNVSALQLAEAGLLDALDTALASSGLDPALLCVEITETALLRETTTVADNLTGIRDRGIRIAVDDFGTAYASLAYLRRHHVDVLKIDRSFVTHVTTSDRDRRLVAGIVMLAEALGMTVTAEGVETEDQAALLRRVGCPGAQGFLYSRAVPPERITGLLDTTFAHG